jgi:hypothetical protein
MKKLLIITPHFWPENFLINDIAKKFSVKGIKVTILTGFPNYPSGNIYEKYKHINKFYINETFGTIKIIRFSIYPRKNANTLNLILNYTSFVINGFLALRKVDLNGKFDKIFIYSISPITTALLGIYLKYKYKKEITLWVQDLWPESVKATNHINNFFIIYVIGLIVKFIYKNVDNIIVQSSGFINRVKKYTDKKIYVVENSNFTSLNHKSYKKFIPKNINNILKKKFCLTFAGNLGKAQSLKTILEAAKKIKNNRIIHFLFIGNGSEKKNIVQYVKSKKLENVSIFRSVDPEVATKICKKSKGLILSLIKNDIFKLTIPNKLQTYIYTGIPIISSCDGIVNNIIQKYKIGFTSKSESSNQLYKSIIKLFKLNFSERKKIKSRMKKLYKKRFNINIQSQKIIKIIFNE